MLQTAICGSTYTTIVLTVDRAIGVTWPFKYVNLVTRFRVKATILIVLIWSVIFRLPYLMLFNVNFSESIVYVTMFRHIIEPVFMVLIPVVLLISCNVSIVMSIRRPRSRPRSLTASSVTSDTDDTERITTQVLGIALFTLIAKCLEAAIIIIETMAGTEHALLVTAVLSTNNFLFTVNATINFFFYYFYGRKFRRQLNKVLHICPVSFSGKAASLSKDNQDHRGTCPYTYLTKVS